MADEVVCMNKPKNVPIKPMFFFKWFMVMRAQSPQRQLDSCAFL